MYHRHMHSSSSAGSGGGRDLFQLKGKVHPGPSLELGEGTSGPVWEAVLADPLGGLFPAEGTTQERVGGLDAGLGQGGLWGR